MNLARRKIDHSRLVPIEKVVRGAVGVLLVIAGLFFWDMYPIVTLLISALAVGLFLTILLGHRLLAVLSRLPLMRFARRVSAQNVCAPLGRSDKGV